MQAHDVNDSTKNKKFIPLDMHQWTLLVKQWDSTKETQQAYCKRLNLNINTFTYVKGKLNSKKQIKNKFVPVTIQPSSSSLSDNNFLVFENPTGIKLRIPVSMRESELLQLLKLIGWYYA